MPNEAAHLHWRRRCQCLTQIVLAPRKLGPLRLYLVAQLRFATKKRKNSRGDRLVAPILIIALHSVIIETTAYPGQNLRRRAGAQSTDRR
jgi:hypothetical protein